MHALEDPIEEAPNYHAYIEHDEIASRVTKITLSSDIIEDEELQDDLIQLPRRVFVAA